MEKAKKKPDLTILYLIMILVIAGLVMLLAYVRYRGVRILDTSYSYSAFGRTDDRFTRLSAFADNVTVSDPSVVIENLRLSEASERALLFNVDTNTPLFAQGIYTKAYPASLSKLMTAIMCMRFCDMNTVITMEPSDFDLEAGSQVSGMQPGDQVTVGQLFHALVVYSANDAAMALARHIDGSVEVFVDEMNQIAGEMGLVNTHFTNPSGLHDSDNYSCAYDIYLLLNEAFRYTAYQDAARMNVYTLRVTTAEGNTRTRVLDSTDKYLTGERNLPFNVTLLGGKTGTTPEAGANLAVYVQNAMGVPYIAVIMNASSRSVLYDDMTLLLSSIND